MVAFTEKIRQACATPRSLLCIGLDPDPARMPVTDIFQFNQAIIDATAGAAGAYKPNLAFYEALGMPGLSALERTIAHIRKAAPDALIIGDAKRGDIGPSAAAYAQAMFGVWGFDAVTVNAWGGADTIAPFLEDESRGAFVWCRGSNPGSSDFQDLPTINDGKASHGGAAPSTPLYLRMAQTCAQWNHRGNIGLVAGATAPDQLAEIRRLCPDLPLLIPGVGAQGGDLAAAVRAGTDAAGRMALINSSRGIIYAANGPEYANAAGAAARQLRDAINAILEKDGRGW